ncbi:MAG: hypothetical protein IPG43_10340 [Proteobacteria bacterium]|nr:hypothetical protein [Pseudomonadota bacterium]
MLALCCTKKALDQCGLGKEVLHDVGPADAALGHWYVSLIKLGRSKALVFMSERTLLSFILHGMRKDNSKELPRLFINGMTQLLELEGFSSEHIERCLPKDNVLVLAKPTNRKALGNLADLGRYYEESIYSEGGLGQCDLWSIIQDANRQPQRNLGWAFSMKPHKR